MTQESPVISKKEQIRQELEIKKKELKRLKEENKALEASENARRRAEDALRKESDRKRKLEDIKSKPQRSGGMTKPWFAKPSRFATILALVGICTIIFSVLYFIVWCIIEWVIPDTGIAGTEISWYLWINEQPYAVGIWLAIGGITLLVIALIANFAVKFYRKYYPMDQYSNKEHLRELAIACKGNGLKLPERYNNAESHVKTIG